MRRLTLRGFKIGFVASSIIALACVLAPATGHADYAKAMEAELNQVYRDRILIVRNFYGGKHLRYDAGGKLLDGGPPGLWTLYAEVKVEHVKLGDMQIEIEGKRILLAYDPKQKHFVPGDHERDLRVEIAADPNELTVPKIQGLMTTVFLSAKEKLAYFVPPYWREFFGGRWTVGGSGFQVQPWIGLDYTPGLGMTPPVAVYNPEPPYSEEARQAGVQGTLGMWLVIGKDGKVADVVLIRPLLGSGLDEQGLETVSTWQFKPATKNGFPATVRVIVEVNFRIFSRQ